MKRTKKKIDRPIVYRQVETGNEKFLTQLLIIFIVLWWVTCVLV